MTGDTVAYCVGDASAAYPQSAGLKEWRRHIALLRPATVVIYDDLEADRPVTWDWLLHSAHEIRREADTLRFALDTEKASARVALFASAPLDARISTEFDPPADNWRGRKGPDGQPYVYPDQWHLSTSPKEKSASVRYLAIIQMQPRNATEDAFQLVQPEEGHLRAGDWCITAELDVSKPGGMAIRNESSGTLLAVEREDMPKDWPMPGDIAVAALADRVDGTMKIQRAWDVPPAAASQAVQSR